MSKSNLMSKSRRLWVSSSTLLLFCAIASAQETVNVPKSVVYYPDTIIYNGKILTMNDTTLGLNTPIGSVVQAMAVRDGKIEAVGSNDEIMAMAGPRTDKIDVKDRMVMPGIIDTHDHIHNGILNQWLNDHPEAIKSVASEYSISGKSAAALPGLITATVKEHVQKSPPGRWAFILISGAASGQNAGHEFLAGKKYTRQMLDKIAPNHPIMLMGSAPPEPYVTNSAGIEGIKKFYGGAFLLEAAGIDDAGLVMGTSPQYTRGLVGDVYFNARVPELADILEEGLAQQAALGITTFSSHIQGQRYLDAFNLLTRDKRMPIRLGYGHWFGFAFGNPDAGNFYRRMGDMAGMGDDYLWQTGVSLGNTDGGPPMTCTTMEAPQGIKKQEYCQNYPGSVQWDVTRTAIANYVRVQAAHAYGDRAVNNYMDAVEAGMKDNPGITLDYIRSRRLTVDHCGFQPSIQQLPRMAKFGMMISCGTRVLSHSYVYLGTGPERYPMRYVKQIAPIRSAIEAKVMPTLELDGTGGMENNTSQTYFFSAVPFLTRKNQFGNDVSPEEAVDRNTLMKMMTSWPARFVLKENVLGTLEAGKFADFLVLSGDFFTTPVDKLADVIPLMTVVGGKVIVLREEFAKELGRSAVGPQLKFENVARYTLNPD